MTEQNNKQSFVMYASFYDAAQELSDEEFREYILALKDYALYGIEYSSQTPMVNGLITMAQPLLEAAAKRRAKQVKNGEFGILGGRKRKGETAEEYKARKVALRNNLMGLESGTPNNPVGFHPVTLNEDVKVDENGKENVDVNPDVEENSKVNKNTNQIMKNDSVFTNALNSSKPSTPGFNMTGNGEELGERRPRQEVVPSHSNEAPDRAYPLNYKCGNYVNLEDVEPGEPDWINCDPNDFPPLVDEGWTPPPPERQHNEVVLPKQKNGDADGDNSIKARELERLISKAVGVIIDCEDGKKPMNMLASSSEMATNAIMELTGCRKAKAVDMIQELKASFRSEQPMKPLKK